MTIEQITTTLKRNPSYLKKGDGWLSERFGCSERTAKKIKDSLSSTKKSYLKKVSTRRFKATVAY